MTQPADGTLDAATETALAKRLFNEVWALLDKPDRTPAEDVALIHLAHASRHHWGNVGTDANVVVGEWQVARVYSELGRGEAALFHATRAQAIADAAGVEPWLAASVLEGLARACAVAGDAAAASAWRAKAHAALDAVADPDDREVVERDLASLPLRDAWPAPARPRPPGRRCGGSRRRAPARPGRSAPPRRRRRRQRGGTP